MFPAFTPCDPLKLAISPKYSSPRSIGDALWTYLEVITDSVIASP